ncbi:hypothetical protein BK809_0004118, partial [Diplodia seriata]
CNYEARRRGLHKLQLVKEAKRLCPDLVPSPVLQRGPSISLTRVSQVIVLGEDLTRFRNASKDLHRFLRQFSWNGRVERKHLRVRVHPSATNTRPRAFARISRSALLPNFVFSLTTPVDSLAERLVDEALLPLFRRLHPEKSGWDLSLVNVAVTNLADSAGGARTSSGRDIGAMFKTQNRVLNQWRVTDGAVAPDPSDDHVTIGVAEGGGHGFAPEADASRHEADVSRSPATNRSLLGSHEPSGIESPGAAIDASRIGSEDLLMPGTSSQDSRATLGDGGGEDETEGTVCWDETEMQSSCDYCGAIMPAFAMAAHSRFHALEEQEADGV